MQGFIKNVAGGLVLMAVATLVGMGANAIRPSGIQLIQKVQASKSTVVHDDDTEAGAATALSPDEVSLDDMRERVAGGLTIVLDARSPKEYAEGHIPGSVNIPYDQLPQLLNKLQMEATPDMSVVTYCRGPKCELSHDLATELRMMGYQDVKVFKGGYEEWSEAGLTLIEGEQP